MDSEACLDRPSAALFSRMALPRETDKEETEPPLTSPEHVEASPYADIISPGSFFEFYQKGDKLQSGSYGVVFEAARVDHRDDDDSSNQKYAVKVINRAKLKKKDDDAVFQEVSILKELVDVPNVIHLINFYVDPHNLYVVQDLAEGGDLFDRLIQRKTYTEQFARTLAEVLLKALKVVHERKIIHRDLKPGNLLLASGKDDCAILLADFGFATHIPKEGYCKTRCGTPMYVAPEVVLGSRYNTKVDCWSSGCIIYMLLGGYPPFHGANTRELFRRIRAGNFTFHEKSWGNVSIPAKQLIVRLLTVNPKHRWSAEEALKSSWMANNSRALRLCDNDLTESLKHIRARRRLKAAMDAVRWARTARFWNPEKVTLQQKPQPVQCENSLLFDTQEDLQAIESVKSTTDNQEATKGVEGATPSPPASPIKTKSFENSYTLLKKVRKGDYATVWECKSKATEEVLAVKIISRDRLTTKQDEQVLNEVSILQSVSADAPQCIVALKDFFEEDSAFYIVMELMTGGDVFDRIARKSHYSERDARALAKQLLEAVGILHKKGVAHRDIKPQNLLLQSPDSDSNMKLCDFGFARRVHTPQSLTHRIGTPPYVAPEILKNLPHDERVDMWGVGVTLYVLLVGYPPFTHEDRETLCQQIKAGGWIFYEPDWAGISPEAKHLIQGLLQVDPVERLSASEALQSKWIHQMSDETLSSRDLSRSLSKLKHKRRDLRGKARKWLANTKGKLLHNFASKAISTPTQAHEECIVEDRDGNFEVKA